VAGQPVHGLREAPIGLPNKAWMALLFAVALLTALEWATYHRRLTV